MAAAAAAAAASKRASQALLRAAPASPAPAFVLKSYCTKIRTVGGGHHLTKIRRHEEKLNQILVLLKARAKADEHELASLRDKVLKLDAYVFYGGILLGALTATALTFPLLAHELSADVTEVKTTQENAGRTLVLLDDRVKALEDALMAKESLANDPEKNQLGNKCEQEPDQAGEEPKPSWLISALTYLKVI